MSHPEVKRLHITPLDSALLNTILHPTTTRPLATEISFHTIQTFPERNYGFVTLPTAEADKLIRKLNGSILKGKKLQIQEARPQKKVALEANLSPARANSNLSFDRTMTKRRNGSDDAIEGYELTSERRVKRGWTEVPDREKRASKSDRNESNKTDKRKKTQKSKYTNDRECLFRTVPPPNKLDLMKPEKRRKRKPSESAAVVVHEFEKLTAYPSFLRADQDFSIKSLTNEYVEGKGWVDRRGVMKEEPLLKRKENNIRPTKLQKGSLPEGSGVNTKKRSISSTCDDRNSSSGASSEAEATDCTLASSSVKSNTKVAAKSKITPQPSSASHSSFENLNYAGNESETSATGSPTGADSEDSSLQSPEETPLKRKKQTSVGDRHGSVNYAIATSSNGSLREENTSDSNSISDDDDSQAESNQGSTSEFSTNEHQPTNRGPRSASPPKEVQVHPLEALFKRPGPARAGKTSLEVNTTFSFFGNAREDSDIEEEGNDATNFHQAINTEPQTPFTKQDVRYRALRSGAPTPDTTAIRRMKFWEEDEEEEENGNIDGEGVKTVTENDKSKAISSKDTKENATDATESEFAKWFWKNRGDNNRAWKRRRREAAKEKRQRGNRQRGRR
ncbi:hypothetical protein PRK78_004501 [Emydomyces testavorans]|uniref:Suppressor protein SRP40 n=1 Tax=Emydomyces testavorans TaxID=2070801 RepID=A0AAF0DIW6_9EURO|nr:hypothetical protein PRK78_004501 [Emydomyces testavorans]